MGQAPAATGPALRGESGTDPELSVILVTDGLDLVQEVLGHLRRQSAADRIELVLVTPPGTIPGDSPDLSGFARAQVVEFRTRESPPAARAAGVTAARAPVVAFAETHCFPEPEWAERLIHAHRGPWTAVGPEIGNENPTGGVSWGNLMVDYSPWMAPSRSGPVADLPGHNSSYKRDVLLEYGDGLPRLIESESILHWDLRRRGHRLYQEAGAKVRHRNITEMRAGLIEHFHNGRCFGALRSREWGRGRRALYVLASPLIPLVRMRRIVGDARRKGYDRELPSALPVIALKLIAHGTGEMTGYALGSGNAVRGMAKYELDRDLYARA